MKFILDEKMKRRILIGMLVAIIIMISLGIFMDFSHTCKGAIFNSICIYIIIIISLYLSRDKLPIEKLLLNFIFLFLIFMISWMAYDNCYCDVHIANYNYVYIPKKIMMMVFFSFGIFIIQILWRTKEVKTEEYTLKK